jgi:cytochrome c-type biogenesis protein CcsB
LLSNLSFLSLFVNCFSAWVLYFFQNKKGAFIIFCNSLTLVIFSIFFVERWVESGHFPISNLYESLIFLSFAITVGIFWLYKLTDNILLYCISSPAPLLINAFASFSLSANLQKSGPLIPALKSNWLLMHVSVMIVSYATLILGCLLSVAFLILAYVIYSSSNKNRTLVTTDAKIDSTDASTALNQTFFSASFETFELKTNTQLMNLLKLLDNLSYRFIGISFPFLTIGIISGAVWANETWGSYWSWDPKETWALITWLVFSIYLHFRLIKKMQGVIPSIVASFGFIVVWICYLGVNLLGKGLHSYGWFN